MNLTTDSKTFKNQVKNLREKLNMCLSNGILEDGFQQQLDNLLKAEQDLLTELIPYYRLYANNITKTSIQIDPVKQLGAFNFDSFLYTSLRISKNLFITGSINGKVQFLYLNIINYSDGNRIEGEWSVPIKEIKETISFIYKLNDREILLYGITGRSYLLSCDSFDNMTDVSKQVNVKRIKTNYDINELGRCLAINDGLFVAEYGDERLNLLEIIKEKDEYRLVLYKEIFCAIPNLTALEKINEDYFAAGTKTGELYLIRLENKQLDIAEKINLSDDEIRQIRCIEDENNSKNSLMVTGNKGLLKIFRLNDGTKRVSIMKTEISMLKGNLFDVQSQKGTALVLSEDGIIYLLEENLGSWYINEESSIKECFFTNVFKLDGSKYLLMNVEGNLNILYVNRISTPKDLWELPLYQ